MMKTILALGVAAAALGAAPAQADRHDNHGWRHHGRACAMWRHDRYRVGYVFGPDYRYTAYNAIPRTYVSRYHLVPDGRYVYTNNTVYVVDPATYAITRILN